MSSTLVVSTVQILIGAVNSMVAIILAPLSALIATFIPEQTHSLAQSQHGSDMPQHTLVGLLMLLAYLL